MMQQPPVYQYPQQQFYGMPTRPTELAQKSDPKPKPQPNKKAKKVKEVALVKEKEDDEDLSPDGQEFELAQE